MKALILRLFLLALLDSVLSAQSTYAQTPKIDSLKQLIENRPDDTVKVDLMFDLGEEYLSQENFDSLEDLNDEIFVISKKLSFNAGVAQHHYFMAKLIGKTKKYNHSLNELKVARNILSDTSHHSLKVLGYIKLYEASIYYRKKELRKAIENAKESILLFSRTMKNPGLARSYRALGIIANSQGNSDLALTSFLQSTNYFKLPKDRLMLATTYNSIGILYMEVGAFDRAVDYLKKSMKLRLDLSSNHNYLAIVHNNLGLAYRHLGQFELALYHFKYSIKTSNDQSIKSNALSNISLIYSSKYEYEKALSINTEVINKNSQELSSNEYAILLKNKGLFLYYLGRYNKSVASLKKTIQFMQKHSEINSSYYIDVYEILGDVYYEKGELDSALYYTEKGLVLGKKHRLFNIKLILITVNQLRISFVMNKLNNNDRQGFEELLQQIDSYDKFLNKQRNFYFQFNDQIKLSEMTLQIYNIAASVCQELYNITNEKHYLQKALTYIEKAKALTFSQSMLDYRAKQFSGIPDSLQEQEKELKIDVAFYQSKISEVKEEAGYDSVYVQELENKLFDSNRAYEVLLEKLENDYPKYHDLKYKTQTIEIEQIQQQLSDNTAVVEYLMGDTTLHVFTITKQDFELQSLPIDSSLSKKITVLQQEFQQGSTKSQLGVDFDKFTSLSHEIYQTILEPALTRLNKKDITRLIIIPDDKLWQVNFELLLTGKSTATDFKELPYLLRDYSVSYGYSSTLLFGEQYENDQKLIQECLAFSFTDSTNLTHGDHLPLRTLRNVDVDLPGSRKEVQAISTVLEGEYYYGASANKQTFKEKAENYAILHLALHGEVDDKEPMNSKLYFTPSSDSSENNSLYAYELYNMSLNAELAVLSACNTGSGQLASGEGIMSLGRAFSYAGVRSLLVSHWDVSDKASPEIMESFYKGLKQGLSKDEALRQAKLAYLENSDIYMANPFFWGGFVVMGDSTAMEFEGGYNWWFITIGISLLLLIIVLYKKRIGVRN